MDRVADLRCWRPMGNVWKFLELRNAVLKLRACRLSGRAVDQLAGGGGSRGRPSGHPTGTTPSSARGRLLDELDEVLASDRAVGGDA
jgi:hypothetical protein